MTKDLKTSIDFFQAYYNLLKQPARDTIRDTIVGRQDTLPPDTLRQDTLPQNILPQDTLQQDTLPRDSISPDTAGTGQINPGDTLAAQPASDTLSQTPQPVQPQPTSPRQTTPAGTEKTEQPDPVAALHDILGVTELPIAARLKNDPAYHNFLYSIPSVKPQDSTKVGDIYQSTEQTPQQLKEKQVQPGKEIPVQDTHKEGYDWITIILVASLLLIGWTRLFYKKYFISLVKSFHFYNYASSLYFGRNSLTQRASAFLNLNFFIITGVLAFQTLQQTPYNLAGIKPLYLWIGFSAFFLVWYAWNFIMSRFIGFVFARQRAFSEYLHNYNLYRKIAGVSLFPIALIVQFIQEDYREIFLIAGGIIFGIIFLVHIIRGLQVFLKENVSIFYLFLYLCALEILPIILVFEVFIRQLSS